MSKRLIVTIVNIATLCLVIFLVSLYFISQSSVIGWVVLGCGALCLLYLRIYKIKFSSVWPDLVFGAIDNGILALLAIFGGQIAGTVGAVIGGVVGNAITDGVAGIFEGMIAERMQVKNMSESRTVLGSSIGKMAGCLLAAGVVLILAGLAW